MVDHFIDLKTAAPEYLEGILEKAAYIKKNRRAYSSTLSGKNLYMLFQKTSTRTALSFASGMTELGGSYFIQKWEDSNFAVAEIRDEIRYVARHSDIVMARLKHHEDIAEMARYSPVPVINGCCDRFHPCQAMADLLTVQELFGNLQVKLLYIGIRNNVLNSLMTTLPGLGGELFAVTPVINSPSVDDDVYTGAMATGRFHDIGNGDPSPDEVRDLIREVDIVYTDTWVDMEFIDDPAYRDEKTSRMEKMLPFQVNRELLGNSKAVIMHDMPMHAGYEISRDVIEDNIETILQQAENRNYAQQAVILYLLGTT